MEAAEGRELYGVAKKLAEDRQWQEAVRAYEQAQTQFGPEDGLVELLNDWAGALLQLKRDEEALSKYEQALRIDPDNRRARSGVEQLRERGSPRVSAAIHAANLRLDELEREIAQTSAAPLPGETAVESESERADARPAGPEPSQAPQAEHAPSTSERRAVLRAFADVPLEDDAADALGFRAYADALAGLIDNLGTGTPLTLAINAPWGAGKSTLAKMIERRLRAKSAPGDGRPHAISRRVAVERAASSCLSTTSSAAARRARWSCSKS